MAWEKGILDITFKAGADLSSKQFYLMEVTSAGVVNAASATTDKCIGVLQNNPTSGGMAVVRVLGISKVIATAAISLNDPIAPEAGGKAQTAVSTQYSVGHAIEAATADGDYITCTISCLNLPLLA